MKVRDTSPGRLYALSSEIGCTAINGAMAVDIPAGGQVVVLALAKKIVIDGDDAAKFVEVRWGTNTVVGSRPAPAWLSDVLSGLISIVGDDNFDINYIPAENKLYLQFSLGVTAEQIEEVKSLLVRVLPSNVVTEIDEMPMTYTRLEYLESTGKQWMDTGVKLQITDGINCRYSAKEVSSSSLIFGTYTAPLIAYFSQVGGIFKNSQFWWGELGGNTTLQFTNVSPEQIVDVIFSNKTVQVNNVIKSIVSEDFEAIESCKLFANRAQFPSSARIYSFSISRNNQLQLNFIPCLDDTGTPCMFDTVTRTPFRNNGSGDFIIGIETQQQLDNLLDSFPNYTGQAIEKLQITLAEALRTPENEARLAEAMAQNSTMPAMRSLDGEFVAPKFYAQLTERGIRRLYHVPKGYIGTMDEYAATNGFKELVEPPMPMTGHWIPEWRETDTQLILDWVETEPPTEELQIEEIENA